ncbi:MAG TPA: bifunctional aspartate kinase/homoserine dehydrogenase I, partial [Gammaproteobacteria bacterium]|nr:bifunctional aspartate kinase/homoserine dehydrogenase I [Gammaproteobacteria bacterium]
MVWNVHKFGGTSVADASCVRRVAEIVAGQPDNLGVVVSAMKGVTDDLLGLVDRAARCEPVDAQLRALRERHERSATELLGSAGAKPVIAQLGRELDDIASILEALKLVRSASQRSRDLISGLGEVWSARQ